MSERVTSLAANIDTYPTEARAYGTIEVERIGYSKGRVMAL